MRYLIISDIHGVASNLPIIKEELQNCDKLIVLGDLYYRDYYHRFNPDYNPEYVKYFLESEREKLICMKGNCDSFIPEYQFEFPMFNLVLITENPFKIYATHGHLYNEKNWNKDHTILLFGHYHIPLIQKKNHIIFINPGSISVPRGNNKPSYAILTAKKVTIYDIDKKIIAEQSLNDFNI
jgi:putative phosphoesterase